MKAFQIRPARNSKSGCWMPWVALLGLTETSVRVPALTTKALGANAISLPVVTVTVRLPVAAVAEIEIDAERRRKWSVDIA